MSDQKIHWNLIFPEKINSVNDDRVSKRCIVVSWTLFRMPEYNHDLTAVNVISSDILVHILGLCQNLLSPIFRLLRENCLAFPHRDGFLRTLPEQLLPTHPPTPSWQRVGGGGAPHPWVLPGPGETQLHRHGGGVGSVGGAGGGWGDVTNVYFVELGNNSYLGISRCSRPTYNWC